MNTPKNGNDSLIISYLTLRKIVGVLGITFPFLLAIGLMVIDGRVAIEDSISSYYHTDIGDVFVGTLCVIGFFLLSYRGYERKDDIAGDLACLFAIGVALFPTTPELDKSWIAEIFGLVHFAFAAAFFLMLTYFSLCLFTKKNPHKAPTRRKLIRNRVYRTCGFTMLACILLIAVYGLLLPDDLETALHPYKPVFWLESIAVVAFGFSWLTKGEAILKDEEPEHGDDRLPG